MNADNTSTAAAKLGLLVVAENLATWLVWAGMVAIFCKAGAGLVADQMAIIDVRPDDHQAWASLGMACLLGLFLLIGSRKAAKSVVGIVTVPLRVDLERKRARRAIGARR